MALPGSCKGTSAAGRVEHHQIHGLVAVFEHIDLLDRGAQAGAGEVLAEPLQTRPAVVDGGHLAPARASCASCPGRRAEVDGGLAAQVTQRRDRQVCAEVLHPPATGCALGAVLKRRQAPGQTDLPGRQRRRLIAVQRLCRPNRVVDETQVHGRFLAGQTVEGRQRRFTPVAAPALSQPMRDHRLRAQLIEKISPLPVGPAEHGVNHATITAGGARPEQVHRGGDSRVGQGSSSSRSVRPSRSTACTKGARHCAARSSTSVIGCSSGPW